MQIKVKDFSFNISQPYTEGMVLGASEARVLNRVRGDNIRGAVIRRLEKLGRVGEDAESLSQLEDYVRNVDRLYEFPSDGPMQVEMLSIQREAEELAYQFATKEAAERGLSADVDWIEQRGLFLSKSEEILTSARRKLEAKKSVAQAALRELLE